ncbi:hypothetical protein [Microbulbifer halophilus]|uniref:hypothetical protein n=1 Tax=Microbulbifer halophilus TaxID=453963 RepID=UPI0036140679
MTNTSVTKSRQKVKIIDGRQVKVVDSKHAKATSKNIISKYSTALNILKDN